MKAHTKFVLAAVALALAGCGAKGAQGDDHNHEPELIDNSFYNCQLTYERKSKKKIDYELDCYTKVDGMLLSVTVGTVRQNKKSGTTRKIDEDKSLTKPKAIMKGEHYIARGTLTGRPREVYSLRLVALAEWRWPNENTGNREDDERRVLAETKKIPDKYKLNLSRDVR